MADPDRLSHPLLRMGQRAASGQYVGTIQGLIQVGDTWRVYISRQFGMGRWFDDTEVEAL